VAIRHGEVIVVMEGIGGLWAVRCLLEIPLDHVTGVKPHPVLAIPDTPSRSDPTLDAFTLVVDGERVLWNVRAPHRAVAILLGDSWYRQLIVEVDDPVDVADRIARALLDERRETSTS
jgi:hypothetical protein